MKVLAFVIAFTKGFGKYGDINVEPHQFDSENDEDVNALDIDKADLPNMDEARFTEIVKNHLYEDEVGDWQNRGVKAIVIADNEMDEIVKRVKKHRKTYSK